MKDTNDMEDAGAGANGPRFVVIGAGMAGILSAIKLKEAGYSDITIYEKATDLGGTWRENTYPGVCCDVPSHLYSYSFAPNSTWTHTFAPGSEILSYFRGVAKANEVEKHIVYGAEVVQLEFEDGSWRVTTGDGRKDRADFVIAATGVLHHPKYPDIPGIDDFGGSIFHSARWDHDVELAGARVGVIGTGSTAVQVTSAIADEVSQYHLFQRTAQWVLPMPNPLIEAEDQVRFEKDPASMRQLRDELSQMFEENFANAVVDAHSAPLKMIQEACLANLDTVADPELRERLRPTYQAGCKRIVVSPDFYEKVQRPNVQVVTELIERIEPGGVRTADGTLHELDVIVLATGFRVDRFMRPIEIIGRDGLSLDDLWAERPWAYLSISVPGFPNLFMLNGPNGPVGNMSLIEVAELQFGYILQLVGQVESGRCRAVSPTLAATERFEEARTEAARTTVWVTGCRSWYLDDRGVPAVWPWTFTRFREEMARPNLDDYELAG